MEDKRNRPAPSVQADDGSQFHSDVRPATIQLPSSRPKGPRTALSPRAKSKGKFGDQHETSFRVRPKLAQNFLRNAARNDDDTPIFEGFLHWTDYSATTSARLTSCLSRLQTRYRASTSLNRRLSGITVVCPSAADVTSCLEAIKLALLAEDADQHLFSTVYLVLPPSTRAMRMGVIGKQEVRDGLTVFLPAMTGGKLSGNEAAAWSRAVETYRQKNEEKLQQYLMEGLQDLAKTRTSMRLRVMFGTVALTRTKEQFRTCGMAYDDFVNMTNSTMLNGQFYKNIRNGALCHRVNEKILQTPQTFCHPDVRFRKLTEVEPTHKIVYCTVINGQNLRMDMKVTRDQYGEYAPGQTCFYRGDFNVGDLERGVRRRLDARVLSIESNHHWALVATSKKTIDANLDHIFLYVKRMLSRKGGKDESGIHFPTLRTARMLNPSEVMWTETTFTYGLVGQEYKLEVSLCRQLGSRSQSAAHTEFRLFSPTWDDAMGFTEGSPCDEWDLGSNLDALFPAGVWDSPGTNRFGSFMATVEQVKSFLVEATSQVPTGQEDLVVFSKDGEFDGE